MSEAAVLYEELRGAVLDRCGHSYGAGHVLVVNRGVVAWMRAWATCYQNRTVRASAQPSSLRHSTREVACELTQVLAAMVLGQRQQEPG